MCERARKRERGLPQLVSLKPVCSPPGGGACVSVGGAGATGDGVEGKRGEAERSRSRRTAAGSLSSTSRADLAPIFENQR